MTINFAQIPVNIGTPGAYVEFDMSRAATGLARARHRTLITGQKLATGTATAGVLYRVNTKDEARVLFGRGSMLARMVEAYRRVDTTIELWVVALVDLVAGTAATGPQVFSGAVTAAGTLNLMVAGQRVPVGITAGQTTAQVATAVAAAVNANPDVPVAAAAVASTVTYTAKHKGVCGNGIDVRINHYQGEATPAGLVVGAVTMTGGAGNPDATDVLAAIGDEPFASVIHPWTDAANLSVFEQGLKTRSDAPKMIDGLAFTALVGALGTLSALGDTRNSGYHPIGGIKGLPQPAYELAAATGAAEALASSLDPARPYQTLLLPGIIAPRPEDRFTRQEREQLLADGISTYTVDDGGNVMIERLITTYRTNGAGFEDTALREVNTLRTLFYLRFTLRARIGVKYPRHKLGNDGTNYGPGQAIVTPSTVKAELVALYKEWIAAGLVEDDLERFKAEVVVERDQTDRNRLNAQLPPDLMNQFIVFAAQIQPIV